MARRIYHYCIKVFYIAIDILFIYTAIYFACWIRQATLSFPVDYSSLLFEKENPFWQFLIFWIITTVFFANDNRLYETRRELFEGSEILLVFKSVFFSTLLFIVALYALKVVGFPRSILLLGVVLMIGAMSVWRILKRLIVEYLVKHGYNNFNVLIIGAGKVGCSLAAEIAKRPALGLRVKGFLDDYKTTKPGDPLPPILGKLEDLSVVAQREFITQIFITIHNDSKRFLRMLDEARQLGISVRVIPQGFSFIRGELIRFNIGFIPILEYCGLINRQKQIGKRVFDFLFSSLAFLILLPVFVVMGILIKLDSPGPVFYRSKRYGRKGRIFLMYKFRTMVRDADKLLETIKDKNEVDGPIFKVKDDPRITKFGKFLRRYSLDELPQLINVIKGEMSLVGPRPFPIDQIERHDLRQYKRLEVRPGITGLWQIRGRSDVSFFRLIKWDLWYINNWSFWLDMYILFQTIPVVIKAKGAY